MTLGTVACHAPTSKGFLRQEYWSGLPFPPLGDLPNPGIEHASYASPALAEGFFTTKPSEKPRVWGGVLINPSVGIRKHSSWFLSLSQLKTQNQGGGLKSIKSDFNPKRLGTRQVVNRTKDSGAEQKPDIYPFMTHSFVSPLCNFFFTLQLLIKVFLYVPGGSVVTNPPANAGDTSLIPESGRSPGE